nr:hypothetical protein [Tanacetum cinerariifolium]
MIPVIYIQQFWDTMCFNLSTRLYSCQLDEQWFNLHKDILRDALDITPTNDNDPFVAPPSSDTVIEYVNTLQTRTIQKIHCEFIDDVNDPKTWGVILRNVSAMSANALYQSWIAILSMINMCLQEEFVQSIQTFLTDRKNLATTSRGKKKTTHMLIPSIRFTKLIIHHLKTKHNIHPKSGSPLHYSRDESILNTLRYVGKDDAEHGKAAEGGATESSKATKETPDESSPAKRSKGGRVRKTRKPMSSLKLVDEPGAANVLVKEPAYNKEEANLQRDLELSLKEQAERTQGPARLVVIREPDSGDSSRFQRYKEKEKKKRRTPMPVEASRHAESPSLDAGLALTDSESESDDEAPEINTGDQDEGHVRPNLGIQDEGQARPNPGVQDEGHAGSNPGDDVGSKPQSSHMVHVGPNLEPMHLEATDFFVEKQQEDESGKTNAEAEVQSMVSVPIHQDTSSVPSMTTLVIDLTTSQSGSPLPTLSATTLTVMTTTTIPPPPQPQQSTADLTLMKCIDELEQHMENLLQYNLALEESVITQTNSYQARQKKRCDVPRTPSGSPPLQPPPPPPPVGAFGAPSTSGALGSSQLPLLGIIIPAVKSSFLLVFYSCC